MIINFFREAGEYYFFQSKEPIEYYTTTKTGITWLFLNDKSYYYFTPDDCSLGIIPINSLTDRLARKWLTEIFPLATLNKVRKFHAAPRHGSKK